MSSTRRSAPRWAPQTFDAKPPGWLGDRAPEIDVCLSSRVRVMRNLVGRRFPHHAPATELREIVSGVIAVANANPPWPPSTEPWNVYRGLAPGERDAMVAERLISPDFESDKEGRAVLLDESKTLSVMVNEEDHLRFQALTPGWLIANAEVAAHSVVDRFGDELEYAQSPRFGYLSSSPYNCGSGVRMSAMFHLIGLAHAKRLTNVIKALDAQGVAARGLFGEASRAIGALLQVSVATTDVAAIQGAGDYLLAQERAARKAVGADELKRKADEARVYAIGCRTITLADSLRVLAWVRWAAAERVSGYPSSPRIADSWLTLLALRTGREETKAARDRAVLMRELLENPGN